LMETSKRAEWPARLALVSRIGAIGWVAGLGMGVAWLAIGPGLLSAELSSMRALFVIGAALGLLSGLLVQIWTREPAVRVDRREGCVGLAGGVCGRVVGSPHVYAAVYGRVLRPSFLGVGMVALHYGAPLGSPAVLLAAVALSCPLIQVAGATVGSRLARGNG